MKYHPLLKHKYQNWHGLEKAIEGLHTTYEKGEVFEQFVYAYLSLNTQLYQIGDLYRTGDIPYKYLESYKLEKNDSGVDGLIIFRDGRVAAYQVKFRTNRKKPSYEELAKFWVEAQHTDLNYVIANCYSITNLANKQNKHLQLLVDVFDSLEETFFDTLFELTTNNKLYRPQRYKPHDFQQNIINDTLAAYNMADRGKVIAACGTGKTLTSLWIAEKLGANRVIYLAPSLALIRQTLEAWAQQASEPFGYLAVCSDKSVAIDVEDYGDIELNELNVPVTTDISDILSFVRNDIFQKKYIFATYQSLPVVEEAFKRIDSFVFDLIIFDEAHRTAGTKQSPLFSIALSDERVPAKKRLFMTATQRMLKPRLKKIAQENDRVVFSMDDTEIYGEVFHSFNFGDAISKKVISDYEIIIAGIQESELFEWIKVNKELEISGSQSTSYTSAQVLFSQAILSRAIREYPINKVISFHSSVNNAKVFTGEKGEGNSLYRILKSFNQSIEYKDTYISHINGKIPTGDRHNILEEFKDSQYGVISNARCLTEGVDVPAIDCVYFVDTKNSIIDIIQACGRALRQPFGATDKVAFFIIPILIPEGATSDSIVNLESFEMVFSILQALRDQDSRLDEWINEINQNVVKGRRTKYRKTNMGPLKLELPVNIDLNDFVEKLYLKIATVNANPSSKAYQPAKKYGKHDRKSGYKRIFRTLGDYTAKTYFSSLVNPTIEKFTRTIKSVPAHDLKVNHNNISHTVRLGLIVKDEKEYRLTPLGFAYLSGEIDEITLFKKQMLRYSTHLQEKNSARLLFPYRACLKILIETESITLHEYAFGINTLYDSTESSVSDAIASILMLREKYPNLQLVNDSNRKRLLDELNDTFGSNYTLTDIWTKRTTLYNQFGYFRNHLSLFSDIIEIDRQAIKLKANILSSVKNLLSIDNRLEYLQAPKEILKIYVSP